MGSTPTSKTLWQIKINWVIMLLIPPALYSISTIAYLTSFHRFVTNPRKQLFNSTANETKLIPGLGESEFFYSLLISAFYVAACIGALLTGFLVICLPYWYLFVVSTCVHILGYTIYGVATEGWPLLISQLFTGFFVGAVYTLTFTYIPDSCARYVQLLRESSAQVDADYEVNLRNKLLGLLSFGYMLGFPIGSGVAVLFTYLNVDQFRSIAWFNVACGIVQLLMLVFLFHGESSCTKIKKCQKVCGSKEALTASSSCPSAYQAFIIVTMLLLSLVDMFKAGITKALLNPILSDSFGLSLKFSSYVYLGLAVPRIMGSVVLVLLQRVKISSRMILVTGILIIVTAYLLFADWQAIPYDPCTEYSPFHHPEIFKNLSGNSSLEALSSHSKSSNVYELNLYPKVKLQFDNGLLIQSFKLETDGLNTTCRVNSSCPVCGSKYPLHKKIQPCLFLETIESYNGRYYVLPDSFKKSVNASAKLLRLLCSNDIIHSFCVNTIDTGHGIPQVGQENSRINPLGKIEDELMDLEYSLASNACMNAAVPGRQCHWIPFSIVTNSMCSDCPPICRAIEQTLNFVQFLLGLFALLLSKPIFWIALMAVVTDHSPKESQGIIVGIINASNLITQSITPLILDKIYEGTQKRTFLFSIVLAALHIPFVVELVILEILARRKSMSRHTSQAQDSDRNALRTE